MKKSNYIVLGLILLLIDQIFKLLIENKKLFIFNYVKNNGIFLGLFPGNNALISLITIILIITLSYFLYSSKDNNFRLSATFILSGLASNLIDRLIHSFVIDYIDLKFWPVFNLADTFIVLGVIGIISHIIKK
jgi:signal peptidase II